MLVGVPIPIALTNPSTWTLVKRLSNEPVNPVIIPLALILPEAVICPAGPLIVTVLDPNVVIPPITWFAVVKLALKVPARLSLLAVLFMSITCAASLASISKIFPPGPL